MRERGQGRGGRRRGPIGRAALVAGCCLAVVGCAASSAATPEPAPSGPGHEPVVVRATDALRFDQRTYRARAGPVTFTLVDAGHERHTLVIDGVAGFELSVRNHDDADQGTVTLAAGTYTLACDVPGHRAAGMTALLVVGAA